MGLVGGRVSIEIAKSYFLRGLECLDNKDFANAEQFFIRALSYAPRSVPTLSNLALAQFSQKKFEACILTAQKLIEIETNSFDAYELLSSSYKELGDFGGALGVCDRRLMLDPEAFETHTNRAYLLNKLERYEEAVWSCDRAIAISPSFAEAFLNRGDSLANLKRQEEASADYDKALSIKPDLAGAWLGRGNVLADLGRYNEAFAAYDKALSIKPDLEGAWLSRGNALADLGRYNEAFAAYDKALSINPDLAGAWLGRGNVHWYLKRYEEAFSAYDKALSIKPDLAGAWLGRGNLLADLKRHDEAFAAYDKAFAIKPDLEGVEGARLHAKMQLCNWNNLEAEIAHLVAAIKAGKANSAPFAFLSLADSPDGQLQCARTWVKEKYPQAIQQRVLATPYRHDKIRVGYASADLHQHAVSCLIAEVLECHDRSRFAVFGFSFGPDDNSSMRRRVVGSFDGFIDCRQLSDGEVAKSVAAEQIDILVDLSGFTQGARTRIFASRSAPIQINYLGYPGTMGAPYMDYIIGDKTLFVDGGSFFSEKLVTLPFSYQPNDRKRRISEKKFTRDECGIPGDRFVFCCFNNGFKILPDVFESWMRILKSVDGSVLWLLADNPMAMANLQKDAAIRGVDRSRLVFAGRMDMPDHLARQRIADLFLDTFPYNAHTTASDALWAGLPVLTQMGHAFAARVAASLLNAINLPDLITHSREQYEALAIELALNPEKLKAIKEKLARNRLTAPLFDTPLYIKHLEAAYETMYRRWQAGLPPDHIEICA